MKRLMMVFLTSVLFAAALPTEGGTYKWEDYFTKNTVDARTTGQTEDQTWIVQSPHLNLSPLRLGQKDSVPYWQILTGEALGGVNGDFYIDGNVVFENSVRSTTTTSSNLIGSSVPAQLILRKGGSLTATGSGIRIGQNKSASVFMEEPSLLQGVSKWIAVGNTNPGALWMDGGILMVTNEALIVSNDGKSEGYVRQNGGTISLAGENKDVAKIGAGTQTPYASVHVAGGLLTSRRKTYASNPYFTIGVKSIVAELYADGGEISVPNERVQVGAWSDSAAQSSILTVDGDAEVTVGLLVMGNSSATAKSIVNLNGGRLTSKNGFSTYSKTGPTRQINFNGGTLQIPDGGSFGISTAEKSVYPKGGKIASSGTSTVTASFRKATGWGVGEITLTNPGSGYVTAPKVTISGGSGTRATAYAVMNKDGSVARVVVTCPGEGYAVNDVVTVQFSALTGTGAAATAVLAENTTPTLTYGPGILVQGETNAFDGVVAVAPGATLKLGDDNKRGAFPNVTAFRPGDGALVRPMRAGYTKYLNSYDAEDGISRIRYEGASGTCYLRVGTFNRNPTGFVLVDYFNENMSFKIDSTECISPSAVSPVVNGLVFSNFGATGYRSPAVLERGADSKLALAATSATPGADVNWCPTTVMTAETAAEIDKVNSITLPLGSRAEAYIRNAGQVEVQSGMIVLQRPQVDVQRVNVTGGGALTTRVKGGMVIYEDQYEVSGRSYSSKNDGLVSVGERRRIFGPFADPTDGDPMSLTVVGEKQSRPEQGAVAWLINGEGADTYTGGLNLINGGVVIARESNLGASGAITAVGNCSVTAYRDTTFGISAKHPICLKENAALIFCPYRSNAGDTVASAISGSGDFLTSDICREGHDIAYTGDHSAFEGDYYIMGHARIAPTTFSARAGICFADGTNGIGVIETKGPFTRPLGTGKGSVCWRKHRTMPAAYGLRGGFAAKGGDLAVNLGGSGETLVAGSEALPAGAVISLQSQYADGALAVANGLDLNGRIQEVAVWEGKSAKLTGELKDSVGGGALKVTGGGTLAYGGTINAVIGPDGLVGNPIAVEGDLTVDGAKIVVTASDDDLKSLEGRTIPLISVSGKLSGKFAYEIANPRWRVKTTSSGAFLGEVPGSAIIIR